jgi:hypothetical protein
VGLYTLSPVVTHSLNESAWFQPLDLESEKPDSKFAFTNSTCTATARLRPAVEAKREGMKEEMMGKLKDLGNSLLGNFGLSTDNFKAEKDDATGSYNIQFVQNP